MLSWCQFSGLLSKSEEREGLKKKEKKKKKKNSFSQNKKIN
jgi:hypothetical protein